MYRFFISIIKYLFQSVKTNTNLIKILILIEITVSLPYRLLNIEQLSWLPIFKYFNYHEVNLKL